MRRSSFDEQELRENLAEIYSLIRQQQRILFRTQAVAEALLETIRESQVPNFEQTFEKHYHDAIAGKIAVAHELALSSLDSLVGRLRSSLGPETK